MREQNIAKMRDVLWQALQHETDLSRRNIIATALRSANANWIPRVFHFHQLTAQLPRPQHLEVSPSEPLFREPPPGLLTGKIFIGRTVPSGHEVRVLLKSFGQPGHFLETGASGTGGKSTLLNFIALRLTEHVPVTIYDVLGQSAPQLVPVLPPERLGVLAFEDYRRNILTGPSGVSQMEWLRASAHDYLMDALDLEPMMMTALIRIVGEIVDEGKTATIPRVLDRLAKPGHQAPTFRALQSRLAGLMLTGEAAFGCEKGIDLDRFFQQSVILNLQGANAALRRLLIFDHFAYLLRSCRVLQRWRLGHVFAFHEASHLAGRSVGSGNPLGEPFFHRMMREARNYGIGFLFADQVPHFEHTIVRSNIGTKALFRIEEPAAVELYRSALGLNEQQRNALMNLPERMLLLRRPDIPYPFLVRIPKLY